MALDRAVRRRKPKRKRTAQLQFATAAPNSTTFPAAKRRRKHEYRMTADVEDVENITVNLRVDRSEVEKQVHMQKGVPTILNADLPETPTPKPKLKFVERSPLHKLKRPGIMITPSFCGIVSYDDWKGVCAEALLSDTFYPVTYTDAEDEYPQLQYAVSEARYRATESGVVGAALPEDQRAIVDWARFFGLLQLPHVAPEEIDTFVMHTPLFIEYATLEELRKYCLLCEELHRLESYERSLSLAYDDLELAWEKSGRLPAHRWAPSDAGVMRHHSNLTFRRFRGLSET